MAKKPGNKVKRRASLTASENKKKEQHTANVETQRPKNPFYRRSVLIPQAKRWQEDLPVQWLEHDVEPNAIWLNEKNDIWLEIPRYENQISWGMGGLLYSCHFWQCLFAFLHFFWVVSYINYSSLFFYLFFFDVCMEYPNEFICSSRYARAPKP